MNLYNSIMTEHNSIIVLYDSIIEFYNWIMILYDSIILFITTTIKIEALKEKIRLLENENQVLLKVIGMKGWLGKLYLKLDAI